MMTKTAVCMGCCTDKAAVLQYSQAIGLEEALKK
jgi:hypothetical protein